MRVKTQSDPICYEPLSGLSWQSHVRIIFFCNSDIQRRDIESSCETNPWQNQLWFVSFYRAHRETGVGMQRRTGRAGLEANLGGCAACEALGRTGRPVTAFNRHSIARPDAAARPAEAGTRCGFERVVMLGRVDG